MINIRLFFAIVIAGIVAIQFFQQYLLAPQDVFSAEQSIRLSRLDGLSVGRIAAYKIKHVIEQPRYDVMIFGNSSALGVQASYFDSATRVFNMSVPGSSLRMTTGLIDLLERTDKTPTTMVVMLNNFEIYDQQIQHMPLPWRWRNSFIDIRDGLTSSEVPLRDAARMAGRLIKEELDQFTQAFNARLLQGNIGMLLALDTTARNPDLIWGGFAADGSGHDMIRPAPIQPQIQTLQPAGGILESYFRLDLQRLARQARHRRLIVYESPLEPNNAAAAAQRQVAQASRLRTVFLETCQSLMLECHVAQMFGEPGQPNRWIDHYHPPAPMIGPYVADLVRNAPQQGGAVP